MNRQFAHHQHWVNQTLNTHNADALTPMQLPLDVLRAFAVELDDVHSPYSALAIRLLQHRPHYQTAPLSFDTLLRGFFSAFVTYRSECKKAYRQRCGASSTVVPFPSTHTRGVASS